MRACTKSLPITLIRHRFVSSSYPQVFRHRSIQKYQSFTLKNRIMFSTETNLGSTNIDNANHGNHGIGSKPVKYLILDAVHTKTYPWM